MGILIDCVRIANFRAIKNLEVNLSPLTMLVGANNSGKTSFLRALHLALGFDRRAVTREDVHDDGAIDPDTLEIIVDVRIVAIDEDGKRKMEFDDKWAESDGFSGQIKTDENDFCLLAFRTKYKFDLLTQAYKPEVKTLKQWLKFDEWQNPVNEDKRASKLESIPLIFIDAQRDIQNDLRDRNSFLGKLTNKPDIEAAVIRGIEGQINQLNERIIAESPKLKHLKNKLLELNKTVNSQGDGVEIMPVNRSLRDIGRNLNINFKDTNAQSFPLEYHGMGTRSWASLLTLNAYISWQEETNSPYCPILALEEPEAHLHPNAQRQLYHQLANIKGQKIVSTHSPFVAAQCDLMNLRHFYKDDKGLKVGQLKVKKSDEDQGISNSIVEKLNYFVLQSRGELIYSKAIVLMEGATEEQALPILYFAKFGSHPFESGVNFISVGGKDYFPYLVIANFLNINWYILSDGDGNSEKEIKAQIEQLDIENYTDFLFVLGKVDFEEYLLDNDYVSELITAINIFKGREYFPNEFIEEFDQQKMKGGQVRNYKNDHDGGTRRALLDCLRKNKFDFSKHIANEICNKKGADGKSILPPKIDALFNKIAQDLKITLP